MKKISGTQKPRIRSEAPGHRALPAAYKTPSLSQTRGKTRGYVETLQLNDRRKLLENQLADICLEIYSLGEERLIPLPPFVLVRLLPRDTLSEDGLIVIPDTGQNKPVFEGIVLETYRPYTVDKTWEDENGIHVEKLYFECDVKRGDRVCMPYYEGVHKSCLGEGEEYRLIRQAADQNKFPYSQCLGVIDYQGDRTISRKIVKLLKQYYSVTTSGVAASRGANMEDIAK
jgi:co-chaperonin GroES (HSP10)